MTDNEKLTEVTAVLLRIINAMPPHDPWLPTIIDIRNGIVRFQERQKDNASLAKEFSQPGTLKNYLLKKGFMPDDEEVAEQLLDGIIKEWVER